jgi:hypothetical protein
MVLEHEFLTLYTTTIASSSVFFFFRIDQPVAVLASQVVQKKEWDLQFDSKPQNCKSQNCNFFHKSVKIVAT